MRYLPLILLGAFAEQANAQAISNELLTRVAEYCVTRESSTSMMVEGRDKGISKEQVFSRLSPLNANSTDAERATFSRLNDVYGMPLIGIKAMTSHRFYACLQGAIDNKEPTYGAGLEGSLLECQNAGGSVEQYQRCVRAAQRLHLNR